MLTVNNKIVLPNFLEVDDARVAERELALHVECHPHPQELDPQSLLFLRPVQFLHSVLGVPDARPRRTPSHQDLGPSRSSDDPLVVANVPVLLGRGGLLGSDERVVSSQSGAVASDAAATATVGPVRPASELTRDQRLGTNLSEWRRCSGGAEDAPPSNTGHRGMDVSS